MESLQSGVVSGPDDGMMRLFPGRVRIPDISYISFERLPNGEVPGEPVPSIVPDLAVEVLESDANTDAEMQLKRREYFRGGVRLVWMVDPKKSHHRCLRQSRPLHTHFTADQTL